MGKQVKSAVGIACDEVQAGLGLFGGGGCEGGIGLGRLVLPQLLNA